MARLIDTAVFIELERTGRPLGVLGSDAPDEPFALASITVAGLLVGAEKADSPERRRRRFDVVDAILARFPVLPYDVPVARAHARVWAEFERAASASVPTISWWPRPRWSTATRS